MASVCFNHKSSFPALTQKQALVIGIRTFPQFTRNFKQVRFLTSKPQGTLLHQKYHYVTSMILFQLHMKLFTCIKSVNDAAAHCTFRWQSFFVYLLHLQKSKLNKNPIIYWNTATQMCRNDLILD